jgi:hypothetical protein
VKNFKKISIENDYTSDIISETAPILKKAGVNFDVKKDNILLQFDTVDMKILNSYGQYYALIKVIYDRLLEIRSFSTENGKYTFKTYNKPRKVENKSEKKSKDWAMNTTKRILV